MPELREQIEAIIAEAQEEDHHGNLLVYSDEATDSILSLLVPILADAEKWRKVKGIAEHAKTPTVEGTCDKCGLLYKCHSLRTRASSGALLVPCIELYRYIDALEGEGEKE